MELTPELLQSYFIASIKQNDIQNMFRFIKMGANINKICEKERVSPIFLAIDSQNPELFDVLCKCGANLNVKNQLYFTPLGHILSLNYFKYRSLDHIKLRMILILLRHGVNFDIQEGFDLSEMQSESSINNRVTPLTARKILRDMGYLIEKNYIVAKDSPIYNSTMEIETPMPFLDLANIDSTYNMIID